MLYRGRRVWHNKCLRGALGEVVRLWTARHGRLRRPPDALHQKGHPPGSMVEGVSFRRVQLSDWPP